jgi:hypothetical protein
MGEDNKALISAVAKAMTEVKHIAKGSQNTEQKYAFASVDDFLAMAGPICGQNGLITLMDEEGVEDFTREGKYGPTHWLRIRFGLTTMHVSGAALPKVTRSVEVIRSGSQAYGSAQSYALKQYLRALLMIPTGDGDDADFQAKADGNVKAAAPADFDPAPHVDAITSAPTGKALLGVIPGAHADHPAIRAAIVARVGALIDAAPNVAALDAMSKAFAPEWAEVSDRATRRRAALEKPANADLGADEIPY